MKTDPNKIKAIAFMPLPTYEHELVSFLGFFVYYRTFILRFSDIVAPLEKICRKTPNINLLYGMKMQRNLLNH